MDPQAPASFIPKKPLTTENRERGGLGGLLFLLAVLIFLASLVAGGATFLYGQYLKTAIASKDESLTRAEAAYDAGVIQDLTRLDARIDEVKSLFSKHVAPTAFFAFLSGATLESVQFTSFTYELASDGSANIALEGRGKNFSAVALQSDQFGASRTLKNVIFSDIKVEAGGVVSFSVQATVDPTLLLYRKNITAEGSAPAAEGEPQQPQPPQQLQPPQPEPQQL